MSLNEKYRPATLSEIVGQASTLHLAALVAKAKAGQPIRPCVLLEGPPGTGKTTAALAVARELGCEDDMSGLHVISSVDLDLERVRQVFERNVRLKPMFGSGWHVVVIEELEACVSDAVRRKLKMLLDSVNIPKRVIVIATSNNASGLEPALLQRFQRYAFPDGKPFAAACRPRLIEILTAEHRQTHIPLPSGSLFWDKLGWADGMFSMRSALDDLEDYLERLEVACAS